MNAKAVIFFLINKKWRLKEATKGPVDNHYLKASFNQARPPYEVPGKVRTRAMLVPLGFGVAAEKCSLLEETKNMTQANAI